MATTSASWIRTQVVYILVVAMVGFFTPCTGEDARAEQIFHNSIRDLVTKASADPWSSEFDGEYSHVRFHYVAASFAEETYLQVVKPIRPTNSRLLASFHESFGEKGLQHIEACLEKAKSRKEILIKNGEHTGDIEIYIETLQDYASSVRENIALKARFAKHKATSEFTALAKAIVEASCVYKVYFKDKVLHPWKPHPEEALNEWRRQNWQRGELQIGDREFEYYFVKNDEEHVSRLNLGLRPVGKDYHWFCTIAAPVVD